MDLLQSMAMDSSMLKWGCRKKCTLRLPIEGEVNKHVDDVGEEGDYPTHPRQQPRQEKAEGGDEKKEQPLCMQQRGRLILRIKLGEPLTLLTKEEKPVVPKPPPPPPSLHELVDEDDQDWKEEDEKEDRKRATVRSKRKRKSTDVKTKKMEKKEIERRPRPEFLFRLTKEQVAEDFELFTGHVHSRCRLRQRTNIDVLCPSSSLPRVFTKDRYSLQMI